MKAVLDDISYKYTLDDDYPIEFNSVIVDKWQKREKKKSNLRWSIMRNKELRKD